MNRIKRKKSEHAVIWNPFHLEPALQLKVGINRRQFPLTLVTTGKRDQVRYAGQQVTLDGRWRDFSADGSRLSFTLTNHSDESIRLTRLVFPAENGLDDFITDFDPERLFFLRNGYQSWSTARSYRMQDKPLRPWLPVVSLASSNLANLPSNIPGDLSSEMFTLIHDSRSGQAFFMGQGPPFNQFFYIRLNVRKSDTKKSFFEIVFDFGRKLLAPGEVLVLDDILLSRDGGDLLLQEYFALVKKEMRIRPSANQFVGWCSWYYYYNKITPEAIEQNLRTAQSRKMPLNLFQIDDGYAERVGDWLDLKPEFEGKMAALASKIRDAGYTPGIWIAPFSAEKGSKMERSHPEYILKNEFGRKITAGYNVFWPGHLYYGLDVTNPEVEEYIRKVIRVIVHEWGYRYLKCDFLFTACLRGGTHHDLTLCRAEVLKKGMTLIREEAGPGVTIVGCGMPLSTGIGKVDTMRVGPDTGPYWIQKTGKLLRTGAMVGVRNSVRNVFVRAGMHGNLWLNDPDCLMLRRSRTRLTEGERRFQTNGIILSGGSLLISDDLEMLPDELFSEFSTIAAMSQACAAGACIPIDLMEREIPSLVYNTAGYVGIFNTEKRRRNISLDLKKISGGLKGAVTLRDVWTGELMEAKRDDTVVFRNVPPHASRLFQIS